MIYVLSNRTAGSVTEATEKKVAELLTGYDIEFSISKEVDDKREYLSKITPDDGLVIVGGDGTLNKFVNSIDDVEYPFPINCYAGGTGNDFLKDISAEPDEFVEINEYIKDLPMLKVNGETYRFMNGVGLGFDGWCCHEVNQYKARTGKHGDYTKTALKGLFGGYKKVNARITVDGVTEEYSDVWLASTMHGRFYGGGMMIAPDQKRNNPEHKLTFAILHAKSPLKILPVFPTVFKGKHVKYTKLVRMMVGHHIKVEFDSPSVLQMDGETIENVSCYEVYFKGCE